MAGKTYVTKGYSTYTNIPAQRGGYAHEPKPPFNPYAVETTTMGRVRAPAAGYTNLLGSPTKGELLKEYVHSPSASVSPKYGTNYENSSPTISPDKHSFSSPNRGYFSEESNRIGSGPGLTSLRNVKTGNISGHNKSWQTAGPPATHHPLTTATNNVKEALGLLEDSVYYSPRADPRRRGVLDELSNRAQPLEPQRRYARPTFVAKPNDTRYQYRERY
ncbi:hypothetical protein HanRHA438_Chr12g0543121 [Helianthus annuus]|nr:hypothetical protein HanRHA438_Chr12g0543121 [Helianthus annuus]